jgi:hypothetical protein
LEKEGYADISLQHSVFFHPSLMLGFACSDGDDSLSASPSPLAVSGSPCPPVSACYSANGNYGDLQGHSFHLRRNFYRFESLQWLNNTWGG